VKPKKELDLHLVLLVGLPSIGGVLILIFLGYLIDSRRALKYSDKVIPV
jgi:hypothetical protein